MGYRQRQRLEGHGHKPRKPEAPQNWERQEGPCPRALIWTSDFQNCENKFPLFKITKFIVIHYGCHKKLRQVLKNGRGKHKRKAQSCVRRTLAFKTEGETQEAGNVGSL